MPNSQKKAATATKTRTKAKAPAKKQGPTKGKKVQTTQKQRKPEDDNSTDTDKSSDIEPTQQPYRKRTKKSVAKDVEVVDNEPDTMIDLASGSDSDDKVSSNGEVWYWAWPYDTNINMQERVIALRHSTT